MINNIPNNGLTMRLLKGKFGVCRLDSTDLIPDWGGNGADLYQSPEHWMSCRLFVMKSVFPIT